MTRPNCKNSTAEKWRALVKQFEASGKRYATQWCRENNISYDSFIFWRRHLKASTEESQVLQSSFVELVDKPSLSSGIEIHRRNLTLTLHKDFDPGTLLQCLQILEKL